MEGRAWNISKARSCVSGDPPSGRLARATPSQFPSFLTWGSASDKVADLEALHRIHISGDNTDIYFDSIRFHGFHPTRISHG